MLGSSVFYNMQCSLETNQVEKRGYSSRPQQLPDRSCDKIYPDLRKAAGHGINCRRQGRPVGDTQRGFIKIHVAYTPRDEKPIPLIASYPIIGQNIVETVVFTEPKQSTDKGLVWINTKQYFKGVPPEVWNFCLGGCQICQKWLKDREGRCLSNTDIRQYQRIVTALKEMIDLMEGIDAVLQHGQINEEKLSLAVNH